MIQKALVATLAFFAFSAQAVTFSAVQSDVTAVALSDGAPDFQSAASATAPVSASAASFGIDIATSGGIAAAGLLSTSADVSGSGAAVVSGVGTAHFLGSFANTGALLFDIGFSSNDSSNGSGSGGSTLFMTLVSGTTTLFNDYVSRSRLFSYAAAPGATGSLELTLSSEANAGFASSAAGGYSSFGQVTFASPVPEPGTYALFAVGLLVTGVATRRRPSRD